MCIRDRYEPARGGLKTWLSIVARTQALNKRREIARQDAVPLLETDFLQGLGLVEKLLKEETRQKLAVAINALGEPEREIIIRRYYYQQKPREIALALQMSVKQIDNRLYQTKRKLRQALSD